MKTILPCLINNDKNITSSKFKYINGGFCIFVVLSASVHWLRICVDVRGNWL